MKQRTLVRLDRTVGAIGLGCMGMSWGYSAGTRDNVESRSVVHAAIDAGVTFIDTADVYGAGDNEILVGQALAGRRDEVTLATKVGLIVEDASTGAMRRDASPAHIRSAVDASLKRLGTEVIDLYYLHRVDENVPLEDTWAAMAELVASGKVRQIGLSEVTTAQAERANAIHPVAVIQSELSLWTRDALHPSDTDGDDSVDPTSHRVDGIVQWCARNGANFVPFAPLGRGFLTGAITAATEFEPSDFRSRNPRFTEQARSSNQVIVDSVRSIAARQGATPAQVALAWVLAQGENVIPIPGTRRLAHLADNVGAVNVELSPADLELLNGVPSAAGARY
jgi:aryl-alcohol dehydrogenase-like predicted oxidoreductase